MTDKLLKTISTTDGHNFSMTCSAALTILENGPTSASFLFIFVSLYWKLKQPAGFELGSSEWKTRMLTTRPTSRPTALILNTNKQHLWRFLSKEFLRRDFLKLERRAGTHLSDTEDPSLFTRQLFKSGAEMLIILNIWNCFQEKKLCPSYWCGNEHQAEIKKSLRKLKIIMLIGD